MTTLVEPRTARTGGRHAVALELLHETPAIAARSVRNGLPAELSRGYGGDLAIPLRDDRPTIVANFVETLDGVVAMDADGRSGGGAVSGHSATDRFVMGMLRAMSDVVVVGAGTVRASKGRGWTPASAYPDGADAFVDLRRALGLAPEPVTLIVSARGDVAPSHPAFHDPATTVVLGAPPAGAARLRRAGFGDRVRIETLGEEDAVSPMSLIELAGRLGARVVLSEGGPHVLGGLASAGLLDELFLTVAPQLAGRGPAAHRLGLIEGVSLWPERPTWAQLVSIRRGDDHLFLRYRFGEASS